MQSTKWFLFALIFLQSTGAALAAGPAYVRDTGTAIVLGNDYLERTISTADGAVGTTGFANKISGRAYAVRGSEIEVRLIQERVGYDFGDENPLVVTARGLRVAERRIEDVAGGKRVTLRLAPPAPAGRGGRGGRNLGLELIYELKSDDFFTRQWLCLAKPAQGTYFIDWASVFQSEWGVPRFSLGGFGQPLYGEDIFLGLEYPTGISTANGSEVKLGGYVGMDIPEGGYTSEPAVIGVAPAGLVKPQFAEYVSRMRVTPVRPYLLYNSWYDFARGGMNHDSTLARLSLLEKALLDKYKLHLDSFVLDDGWDDMQHLWTIDEKRFPGGFSDLSSALKGIASGVGLWFGPIGGYGQRQVRISTGKREGMEITTNGQYLCIAGKNYSRLLSDTMARYEKDYGVNYYKIDGTPFGCNDPDHGHPVGIYSREADTRALIGMIERLRAQDPKVFLNITTSIWLSPWWLRYADTVWMGGEDSGYLASVPTLAPRQSAVSYRDSVLYSDFVTHQAQFPMSSLMTCGIIKGSQNMLGGEKEFLEDWKDEVVHHYSVGNMMYELYISADILTAEEMDALGNATLWAEANAHPLLDNSTMVLGDPARREPYGYVHSSAEKSIVMLRNPFVRPATVQLKVDEEHGFRKTDRAMILEIEYPYREVRAGAVRFGDTLTFDLGAYEQTVLELRPAAENRFEVEGVRYSSERAADGSTVLRLYAPQGSTETVRLAGPRPLKIDGNVVTLRFGTPAAAREELTFAPSSLRSEGVAGAERTVHVATAIQAPADYRESRLAFLIEPEQDLRGVKAEGLDNGKPFELTLENGNRGTWHWFWANLAPGRHALELTFHLPAAPGSARVSGWLLTGRALASQEFRVAFPPGQTVVMPGTNLLPASSGVERGTYALIAESIP